MDAGEKGVLEVGCEGGAMEDNEDGEEGCAEDEGEEVGEDCRLGEVVSC